MRMINLLGAAMVLAMVPSFAAAQSDPNESTEQSCPGATPNVAPGVGGTGQSEQATEPSSSSSSSDQNVTVIAAPEEGSSVSKRQERAPNEGFTISAAGGVEGYTSSLAPRIKAGPSWGVNLTAAPSRRIALEGSYIGSNNRITDDVSRNSRIIRNAGNVDLKVALSPTPLEPYIFGGVGISSVTIRNEVPGSGYKDDTFGQIPVGAGVNYHYGSLTAGARFTFNYLFDRNFTPPTRTGAFGISPKEGGDIYDGQISIGGTF